MSEDTITVARARNRRLTKLIRANGKIEDYDRARLVDLFSIPVRGLDAVRRLLHRLVQRPDCAVLRGEIIDPARRFGVRRLVHPDRTTGEAPTLRAVPRRWLALDLDAVERPADVAAADLTRCATAAIKSLPEAFHEARCIIQATAGHGLKPQSRLRLWFWLERPLSRPELKVWLVGSSCDSSIFGAAQPIYTAAPVFETGIDHLPCRIVEILGSDQVSCPSAAELAPPPRNPPTVVQAIYVAGSARAQLYVAGAQRRAFNRISTAAQRHPAILAEACGLARFVHLGLMSRADLHATLWDAAQVAGKDDEAEIGRIIDFGLDHPDANPLPVEVRHG